MAIPKKAEHTDPHSRAIVQNDDAWFRTKGQKAVDGPRIGISPAESAARLAKRCNCTNPKGALEL